MADNSIDIYIRMITQQTGEKPEIVIAKLKNGIGEMGMASKKAGELGVEAAKEHTKHIEGLHRATGLLFRQFGEFGHLLHGLVSGPALAFTALAIAIGKMREEWAGWLEGVRAGAANAAQGIGDIKKVLADLAIERIKADEKYKASLEKLDAETKKKIDRIHEEQTALEELTTAREKAEMAGAKTDEERAAISHRYAGSRRGAGEQFAAREIAAREGGIARLGELMGLRAEQSAESSHGLTSAQVTAKLADLPNILKSLDDQIAEQKKVIEELKPGYWMTLGMMTHGKAGVDEYKEVLRAESGAQQTLGKMIASRSFYAGLEKPLTNAQVANADVVSLQKRMALEQDAVGDLRGSTGRQHVQNLRLGGIESGNERKTNLLLDAAAGADAIRGGGRATNEQAQAMNQATSALGLQGQNTALILSIMSKFNDEAKYLNTALKTLDSRLNIQSVRQ